MDNNALAERLCRMHIDHHLQQITQFNQTVFVQGEDAIVLSLYLMDHPAFAGEFCEKLGLTTGQIANILKKLEEKQYITRTADREDRRRVHVTLTDAGRQHAEKKYRAMVRVHRELLDRLGEKDGQELLRILARLENLVGDMPSA